jgi:hypothetical protein
MNFATIATEKKTIIGAKVTNAEKERILGLCKGLNCSASDYFKNLIKKDMARAADGNVMRITIEDDRLMIPCSNCSGPVSFKLADLGLRPI